MDAKRIEEFLAEQDADRETWYADMRGAAVSFGKRQSLADLTDSLTHCRSYLEEKKREWIHALLFTGKASISSLTFTVYGDMQLVRAQLERCKSLIIAANGRPTTDELDGERPRFAIERLAGVIGQQEAIRSVSWTFRDSLLNANRVLILTNNSDDTVQFILRCIAMNGFEKDISIRISPGASKEIGSQQGWAQNWVAGEKFELRLNDEIIWRDTFP